MNFLRIYFYAVMSLLVQSKKRKREHQEDDGKKDIQPDIRGYAIQDIRIIRLQEVKGNADQHISDEYKKTI